MKKIDKLLLTGVIPPFIMTFSIALFVLMMQMLWKHIDDIMGKGASIFMILEYLFYLAIHLIPMALPLAVLMSSLMVIGNLAERYELAVMKSAGIPLVRIMRPLMGFGLIVAIFAFFCANNLTPIATLKFKSRLQDMKKQKPTLSLEEGVFNEDFNKVTIRIGKKDKDGEKIEDVLIYDQDKSSGAAMNRIVAEKGRMYTDAADKYFVMQLENGTQYQAAKKAKDNDRSLPFVRTSFKEYIKIFDLAEFEIQETDAQIYKNHHAMLSSAQLLTAIDSIDIKSASKVRSLLDYVEPYLYFKKNRDTSQFFLPVSAYKDLKGIQKAKAKRNRKTSKNKPTKSIIDQIENKTNKAPLTKNLGKSPKLKKQVNIKPMTKLGIQPIISPVKKTKKKVLLINMEEELGSIAAHIPAKEKIKAFKKAVVLSRGIRNQCNLTITSIDRLNKSRVKHTNELYRKMSMAFACFMFLFIGAPMGAIIRKGGFGFPVLVSTLFFVLYIILLMSGQKLSEKGMLTSFVGAWLPCIVLAPVSIFLTYKALNDSKILDLDLYLAPIKKLFEGKEKRTETDAT